MIKWDLSQGCKDFSISANWSLWYTTLTKWRIKTRWLYWDILETSLCSASLFSFTKCYPLKLFKRYMLKRGWEQWRGKASPMKAHDRKYNLVSEAGSLDLAPPWLYAILNTLFNPAGLPRFTSVKDRYWIKSSFNTFSVAEWSDSTILWAVF